VVVVVADEELKTHQPIWSEAVGRCGLFDRGDAAVVVGFRLASLLLDRGSSFM
jgi:hypothetical protein